MAPSATATVTSSHDDRSKPAKMTLEPSHEKPSSALADLSHGLNGMVLPGIPKFTSTADERTWILEHMAAVFRHWSREDYVEGISGHISVRDPEFPDCIWMNPYGMHFGLITASDLVMVRMTDGRIMDGNKTRPIVNQAGFFIHSAIHKARPDVHAICHTHSPYGRAWSVFGRPLEMLTQDVCKFYGDAQAVYDNHGGVVLGPEEGERIAASLGPNGKGALLRNHGILTVGTTVDEAAFLFTSMERSCRAQLLAEAAAANGIEKKVISDEEAEFNYRAESDPDLCYAEFQAYFDLEKKLNCDFML